MIARIVEHARRQPSPFSTTDLWHIGGAVARFGPEHAAYHGRDDSANIGWLRAFLDDMAPYSDGGRYLNFAGFHEEGAAMVHGAYGHQYARLADLKAKYDPANLFRLNQNITPSSGV